MQRPLHELANAADHQVNELGFRLYDKGYGHNEAHSTAALVQNIADDLERFVHTVRTDFPHADPDIAIMLAEVLADGLGLPAEPLTLIKAQMAWKAGREEAASGMRKVA